MSIDHVKAVASAGIGVTTELAKNVPILGCLIAGAEKYYESIQEQQREAFVHAVADKLQLITENAGWYQTSEGQQFAKKVISSAMNSEYADKIEYFANALANGPTLKHDDPHLLKFVEILRHISKPALEVLAVAVRNGKQYSPYPHGTPQVMPGHIAAVIKWPVELVDACVRELHAAGVFSSVIDWSKDGEYYQKSTWTNNQEPAVIDFTIKFANFVLAQHRF